MTIQVIIRDTKMESKCMSSYILDDTRFRFDQIVLISKVLGYLGMNKCDEFPTTNRVEGILGTDKNFTEA